jgi:hypothetical protein
MHADLAPVWFIGPLLLWRAAPPRAAPIAALLAVTGYAASVARRERTAAAEPGFRGSSRLWEALRCGAPWALAAVPLLALTAAILVGEGGAPELRPEGSLQRLGLLLVLYASVSVTSQEFLYSSFFFWRYRPMRSPGFLVWLNTLAFGVAHVVYDSWVSVALAVAARLIPARVHRRYENFWGCGRSRYSR